MKHKKFSGVLCHFTSLPTAYGIGDFGPVAFNFVDALASAGQTYWQVLPVANTDDSGCPYATDSAFGCAEFYISPDFLAEEYQLDPTILKKFQLDAERVNFKKAKKNKQKILALAYSQFQPNEIFEQFLQEEKTWIEDYCIFRALSETRGYKWIEWGSKKLTAEEKDLVDFHKFCQYSCFSQLANLKKYANDKGIKLIGDLPIFVSYISMDVWKNPKQFFLNNNLTMEYETGAAPDVFSTTGQKWGTPIYDWHQHKQDNYKWWNERLSFSKRYFDIVRIDHFRGFCATWISKVSDKDASGGEWYKGPGSDLFKHLRETPEIIAEDLGHITPDVNLLRDEFKFPTMKVFQFLLGEEDHPQKIYNYHYNSVAYSGTHDCDTLAGWYRALTSAEKEQIEQELKIHNPDHWILLKVLMETPSKIVLVQVQDLLGLGSEARFNYPGTVQDINWTWKLSMADYQRIDWSRLSDLTHKTGRTKAGQTCG
jgi:4-alpha-glucanotransferase